MNFSPSALPTAYMAIDIHYYSYIDEFLFCWHLFELITNSSLIRVKSPSPVRIEVSSRVQGETSPDWGCLAAL